VGQTAEELLALQEKILSQKEESPENKTDWSIIFLLFVFYPAAFYLMVKTGRYHKLFAWLLWFFGLSALATTLLSLMVLSPQMETLYSQFSQEPQTQTAFGSTYFMIGLGIFQLIFGTFVFRKVAREGVLKGGFLVLSIILLLADSFVIAFSISSAVTAIITPLYNSTSGNF
jgi:MFS family permease